MHERPPGETSPYVGLWAVVVYLVAFLPRIVRAWEPREELLSGTTPDDAYYYFAIARNIIEGNGASFDGEHVTNGFHPLWQAIITPLWVFNGDVPIHLALTLGAVFGALAAMLAFLFLNRATGSYAPALVGSGFFALHPQAVTDSVNGLESSISIVLLAGLLLGLVRLDLGSTQRPEGSTIAQDALFGVICGLLMLARTDMVFVVGAVLVYVALRVGVSRWIRPLTMGGVALLCMVPWFAWSYLATGSLVQISGRAGGVYFRAAYVRDHGDGLGVKISHGLDVVRNVFASELPHAYFIPLDWPGWPVLLLGVVAVGVVLAAAWRVRGRYADAALALGVAAGGFALGLAFHGGIRWFTRTWYYTPAALLAGLAIGLLLHGIVLLLRDYVPQARRVRGEVLAGSCSAVAALLLIAAYQPHRPFSWSPRHESQLQMYDGALWLRENSAADARAGSFNAGIIGYFSERTVVNLDGVVNEDSYHAIDDCLITEYVRDEELDYVVDFSQSLVIARCGPPVVTYELEASLDDHPTPFGPIEVLSVTPVEP